MNLAWLVQCRGLPLKLAQWCDRLVGNSRKELTPMKILKTAAAAMAVSMMAFPAMAATQATKPATTEVAPK